MLLDTTLDTVETPDVLTSLHQIATNKLVMKIILLAVKFGSNFLAKKKKRKKKLYVGHVIFNV